MKLRFFTVPILDPEGTTEELNRFLGSQRILSVERHFVDEGASSAWAVCVCYVDRGDRPEAAKRGGRRERVDYRNILYDAEFAIFAKLRTLRKSLAERDGLPAYAVFTNDQLAAMVQQQVTTTTGLGKIPGIGAARVQKYGEDFLQLLKSTGAVDSPPQSSTPAG